MTKIYTSKSSFLDTKLPLNKCVLSNGSLKPLINDPQIFAKTQEVSARGN